VDREPVTTLAEPARLADPLGGQDQPADQQASAGSSAMTDATWRFGMIRRWIGALG
jgi:hypothetical protein